MNEYDQSISIVLKQHSNSIDIVCLLFKESSRKLGSITELAACKDASEMVKEKCFNFEITSVIANQFSSVQFKPRHNYIMTTDNNINS